MIGITRKNFVNYAILPGIRPRLQEVFFSGFRLIPYFMALVYQAVRLLPPEHPYVNPANIGKFGIRHVIAAAANALTLQWKNIDQIALFIILLVGIVIGIVQIILLGMAIMVGSASAASTGIPGSFAGFFLLTPAEAQHDLAYMMFDLIFGIKDMFKSCIEVGGCQNYTGASIFNTAGNSFVTTLTWPFPVHVGLHQMFLLYSTGLMVVATLIAIYFAAALAVETAQTGTPFGRRFNKVWAPLRIVAAFGLLIPMTSGLNSSQFIVLYAAKFGSGFASNGWKLFNANLTDTYLGAQQNLVPAQYSAPELNTLIQFLFVAETCWVIEESKRGLLNSNLGMYAVRDNVSSPNVAFIDRFSAPLSGGGGLGLPTTIIQNYQDLIKFAGGDRQVTLRFGDYNPNNYQSQKGYVQPLCGELTLFLVDPRDPSTPLPALPGVEPERAAVIMQAYYLGIINELWYFSFAPIARPGARGSAMNANVVIPFLLPLSGFFTGEDWPYNIMKYFSQWDPDPNALLPPAWFRDGVVDFYHNDIKNILTSASLSGSTTSPNELDPIIGNIGVLPTLQTSTTSWFTNKSAGNNLALYNKGWAAAGIWYNKIAALNGLATAVATNTPTPTLWPEEMENLAKFKKEANSSTSTNELFNPDLHDGATGGQTNPDSLQKQTILWEAYKYWQESDHAKTAHTATQNNPITDFINALLGTSGLYSMRNNPNVHPLAQVVVIGKSLMEAAKNNFILAAGGSGLSAATADAAGKLGAVWVSFFMTLTMITLTAGFVLFYVIPFIPFIYFFFAVGTWFKAIFEAMVGAPLWALAHIRIDGDGLPGRAAVNGYYMIFEIFLRPILIVFGLLASVSIFSAMVTVLNQTWDIVSANLTGFDVESEVSGGAGPNSLLDYMRGPIDEFFFTVIYAIMVYMLGMSCFKLIDAIPASILRWMGQSVETFNDGKEDVAQDLIGRASVGSQQTFSALGGGVKGALEVVAKGGKG